MWEGLEPHSPVAVYFGKEVLSMPESNFMALMENCDVGFSMDALKPALERYKQIKEKLWKALEQKES